MHRKKILTSILVAASLIAAPANANVGAGMQSWFNSMGGFSNTTPPSSYQGQTMNGFSGGGFYARTPTANYQLANMTPPSLNVGCGGIDLTAGSFSFINRAQLTAMFQNIGTSISYGFLLAIKSSMPQMASLFEYLQDAANKVNAMNVNTCQMTQGVASVVGSAISDAKANGISHTAGVLTNQASDAFSAWSATPANKQAAVAQLKTTSPTTASEISPGNVVWQALSHTTGLDNNDKLFIMSMTGTIIINDANSNGTGAKANWRYVEPTGLTANDFIGYNNEGPNQPLSIFTCDTPTDCLNPTVSPTPVPQFLTMVTAKLNALETNLANRQQQNVSDFYLVDVSSIPVWKMISVSNASTPNLVGQYTKAIAVDIAYKYITSIFKTAKAVLANSENETKAADASEATRKLTARMDIITAELYQERLVELELTKKAAEDSRALQLVNQSTLAGLPLSLLKSIAQFGGAK